MRFPQFYSLGRLDYDVCTSKQGGEKLINQVTLVGRITRDPELKYTADGIPVANITLAVNRNFRNSNGYVDADFVQCTLWRKSAENTVQYCKKGSILGIVGRIQTRNYDNSEGKRVYVTEVIADSVRFLGGRPAEDKELSSNQAVSPAEGRTLEVAAVK